MRWQHGDCETKLSPRRSITDWFRLTRGKFVAVREHSCRQLRAYRTRMERRGGNGGIVNFPSSSYLARWDRWKMQAVYCIFITRYACKLIVFKENCNVIAIMVYVYFSSPHGDTWPSHDGLMSVYNFHKYYLFKWDLRGCHITKIFYSTLTKLLLLPNKYKYIYT